MNLLVIALALASSPADAPRSLATPTFEVREYALRTADGSTRIPPNAVADGSTRIPPNAVADGSTRIPPNAVADGSTRIPPKGLQG